jgi:hypothetical protein
MTELIGLLIGALLGLAAVLIDRRRRASQTEPPKHRPEPPKHTATEHKNATHDSTAAAVASAADAHGVDPATTADDLDWLESDDL